MFRKIGAAIAAATLFAAALPASAATLIESGTTAAGASFGIHDFGERPLYIYSRSPLTVSATVGWNEFWGIITTGGQSYDFIPSPGGGPADVTSIPHGYEVNFSIPHDDAPVYYDESFDGLSWGFTEYHYFEFYGLSVDVTPAASGYRYYVYDAPVSNPFGAVPEPGTWAMMIIGFGLAGAAIRRQRFQPRLASSISSVGSNAPA